MGDLAATGLFGPGRRDTHGALRTFSRAGTRIDCPILHSQTVRCPRLPEKIARNADGGSEDDERGEGSKRRSPGLFGLKVNKQCNGPKDRKHREGS